MADCLEESGLDFLYCDCCTDCCDSEQDVCYKKEDAFIA